MSGSRSQFTTRWSHDGLDLFPAGRNSWRFLLRRGLPRAFFMAAAANRWRDCVRRSRKGDHDEERGIHVAGSGQGTEEAASFPPADPETARPAHRPLSWPGELEETPRKPDLGLRARQVGAELPLAGELPGGMQSPPQAGSIGWLAEYSPETLESLQVTEHVVRSPVGLAWFLEAAHPRVLETALRFVEMRRRPVS